MDTAQQTVPNQVPNYAFFGAALFSQPHLQQLAEVQWKLELSAKIAAIVEKLREKFAPTQNVCLCQAWLGVDEANANPNSLEVTLWADPRLGIVLDPLFQELRLKSCQAPVFFRNSMPGKVWRSGAVQIVQNLRILPPTLHPRSQLSEEALERLAEALYIPIYDLARPARGQVCVLEVLLSSRATEAMLVADVISFIGNLLTALQLSLANPVQQPVRRSVLCGRRARAPDSDGETSGEEEGAAAGGAARSRPRPAGGAQEAGGGGGGPSGGDGAPAAAGRLPVVGVAGPGPVCASGATAASAQEHAPGGQAVAAPCSGGSGDAVQAVSELPTLPASPSPERQRPPRGADPAMAAAAGVAAACAASAHGPAGASSNGGDADVACPGQGGWAGVPRKVRKVLDGAMQRSKSVASVAALSNGASDEEEEEEEEAGVGAPGGQCGVAAARPGAGQPGPAFHGAAGCGGPPLDPRSAVPRSGG